MTSGPVGSAPAGHDGPPAVALRAGRALALARVAIGGALIVAPAALASPWLGPRTARRPAATVAVRALGVRDVLIGALALHTLSHGRAAERVLAACAVADAVDGAATWAVRDDLPAAARGVAAFAAGSAAAHLGIAAGLRRPA